MTALTWLLLGLAAFPAALFITNLFSYRRLPFGAAPRGVSVLIPARNEERSIGSALESVLANRDVPVEVVVLDDHSTDATARIVASFRDRDPRVRLISGISLPPGWCGKQHACWQLAQVASHDTLLFMDADVRLSPNAAGRISAEMARRPHLHLLSGVPRQETGSFLERLLIPLIHFILLSYLPLPAARRFRWTAFAAGCGQLFAARRDSYFKTGGHQAIRGSLHDGVTLPRNFRAHGFATDIFDATDVSSCRMYSNSAEVWRGLGKNATEGLASPGGIGPWTLLLAGGHVLPWILLLAAVILPSGTWPISDAVPWLATTAGLSLLPRLLGVWRFRQSLLGALLHPLGIAMLLVIQWQALFRKWGGRPMEWRGRSYLPSTITPTSSQARS
ncbi:MAG: glycosyltransferase [Verrucomicrobiales bacterium]|nr:glycosyltransferase [Verrucomicrobiales bacterium]